MLQNKKFIAILVILLMGVAYNNFKYFFMNEEDSVAADYEENLETDMAYEEDTNTENLDEGRLAQNTPEEDTTEQDSLVEETAILLVSTPEPSAPEMTLEMASISDLTPEWAPFLLEDSARNPFLTKEEENNHRNPPKKKPVKRRRIRKRSAPLITSKMVKMIYMGDDDTYAVINGKTRKEGDQIGQEKLLSIREGAITLLHKGKEREIFISGQRNQKGHHVEISYE